MASTTKGIVYPTSGDNIAPLETHFASLAQSADDAIGDLAVTVGEVDTAVDTLRADIGVIPKAGTFNFSSPTSTATPVNITVTLPGGHFSTAPTVVASVAGISTSGPYFAVVHSITPSQFQANIWRTAGTTAESLVLQWIAK